MKKIWQKVYALVTRIRITKRLLAIIAVAAIIALIVALPLIAGTKTYPLTIVEGDSMYPYLQNGDLVFYKVIDTSNIPNGTIIAFKQEQTSNNLLPPVVIHRVVGKAIQPDGTVYYKTKGDNNKIQDTALVKPENILGSEALIIPKLGYLFLFLRSAQGLVTIVALILGIHLLTNETKSSKAKKRDTFIAALAVKTLNGELSDNHFRKFEMAIKHVDSMNTHELLDAHSLAIAQWIRKGALEQDWRIGFVKCNICSCNAMLLENKKGMVVFFFCMNCAG